MIERRHEVMTDERLELLAERFIGREVRELLHISFGEYVLDPEHYDGLVDALVSGRGLVGTPIGNGRLLLRVA